MAAAKDIRNKSTSDMQAVLGHHIPVPAIRDSEPTKKEKKRRKDKDKKKHPSYDLSCTGGEGDDVERKKTSEKKAKKRKEEDDWREGYDMGRGGEVEPKKKKKRTSD